MYKYGPRLYYFIVYAQSSSTGTLLNLILLFEVDLIPQLCLYTGIVGYSWCFALLERNQYLLELTTYFGIEEVLVEK